MSDQQDGAAQASESKGPLGRVAQAAGTVLEQAKDVAGAAVEKAAEVVQNVTSNGEETLPDGHGGTITRTAPSTSGSTYAGGTIVENDVGESMEELMAAIDATIKPFDDGDLMTGTVVKIDKDEVLLDIGYKSEGVIPSRELSIRNDVDPSEIVSIGDQLETLVLQKEDKDGRLILSKKRAQYERAWGKIEEIKQADGTVSGPVIEVVKGGLIVDIGLRGFLPASLVEMRRVRDLHPYVGKELECKVIELDKNRNNVVLSRRKFLEESQAEQRHDFLGSLNKGEVRQVSSHRSSISVLSWTAVDGLVHVSELSWKHVDHPGEVVEVGQEVNVEVLDVDLGERVSLSLKATQEDPWRRFARKHNVEDVIEAGSPSWSRSEHSSRSTTLSRPGPHLGARRASRRAGRGRGQRPRPCHGQDHRHRSGPQAHQPLPEAGDGERRARGDDRDLAGTSSSSSADDAEASADEASGGASSGSSSSPRRPRRPPKAATRQTPTRRTRPQMPETPARQKARRRCRRRRRGSGGGGLHRSRSDPLAPEAAVEDETPLDTEELLGGLEAQAAPGPRATIRRLHRVDRAGHGASGASNTPPSCSSQASPAGSVAGSPTLPRCSGTRGPRSSTPTNWDETPSPPVCRAGTPSWAASGATS